MGEKRFCWFTHNPNMSKSELYFDGDENFLLDILHPELMPLNALRSIILGKSPLVDAIQELSREKLLEMYYKMVMPLPKREPRKKRWDVLSSSKMDTTPPIYADEKLSQASLDCDWKVKRISKSSMVAGTTGLKRNNSWMNDSVKLIMDLNIDTSPSTEKHESDEMCEEDGSSFKEVLPRKKRLKQST